MKNGLVNILVGSAVLLAVSCAVKDNSFVQDGELDASSLSASLINATETEATFEVSGRLYGATGAAVGICYGTSPNPTTASGCVYCDGTVSSAGNVNTSARLDNLTGGTMYYVRPFVAFGSITRYGQQITFNTVPPFDATTLSVTVRSITSTDAVADIEAVLVSGEGATLGVCYSTSPQPLKETGTAVYATNKPGVNPTFSTSVSLQNLKESTTYYIRAFATAKNGSKTVYGPEKSFTTKAAAYINILSVSVEDQLGYINWKNLFATYDGTTSGVELGFCYSTSHNPTYNNNRVMATQTGSTFFAADDIQFSAGQLYYMKAYAKKGSDIFYSDDEVIVQTLVGTDNPSQNPVLESSGFYYEDEYYTYRTDVKLSCYYQGTTKMSEIGFYLNTYSKYYWNDKEDGQFTTGFYTYYNERPQTSTVQAYGILNDGTEIKGPIWTWYY